MVDFYFKRGEIAIQEAELLAQNGYFLGSISRMYYGLFYFVSAFLYAKGLRPKSHKGTLKLFNNETLSNPGLTLNDSKHFHSLFNWRQESDYGDFVTFEKEEMEALLLKTKALISLIRGLIQVEE
jgi:uncharacterized protein (UPF0332 family)